MTQSARVSVVPRAGRFERPRPRLLGKLAEAADVSLVVLVAPSGYGKTTLLAQYARSTPRRVAWCRVSGAHEGPGDVVDRLAGQLSELDGLRNLDDRIPDEVLARRLADGLASLEQGIDLIVDNVEDERLNRWLGTLADRLEEGHRLLLSSHSTDGLRLAHRLAESSVLVLGTGDLRFDPAETQAYLEARGESLSAEQLGSLAGWPAGLALSAHGGHHHAEIDDLVLEALQALPPELLVGLPPLALLEFWSEADATVLSPDLPDHWLKTLLRAGLPITPLGGGVFQPHQLLVRVLERLLLQRPDRARASRATAARLLEASGALERAAQLYRQAEETGDAVRLAERLVPRYRDRGEHRLTRALLEPLEAAPLPPALQERLAWAQLETGSSREGEVRLQALRDAGLLTPAGFASLATVRGRQGRFEEQLALAQEGLTRVGTGVPVPALSWPLVFASIRLGLFRDAEETAARFVALAEQGDDQVRLAEAWQLQGAAWRYSRPAAEARMPLIRARAVYEGLGWYGRAADLQLDELELSIRNGEVDGAAARLRALESVVVAERAVHHARRLRLLGAAERRTGQLAEAEAALQLALEATRTGGLNLDQSGLPLEWADCLLQQRRPDEAAPWLQMGVPAGLGGRRAVLESLRTGAPLELSLATAEEEQDAETRLRALLLLTAQGAPGALCAARSELARSRHTPYLQEDRALAAALAGTKAAALLNAPAEPPTAGEGLLLNLKIQTLGDFQAHLNGQAVQVGLAKARELLIWLAVHGSGSRDELVTALWDGSAEERHVEYFRVAVRRLRGALKPFMPVNLDPLPYADTRYRLAPELHVEIDVLAPVSPAWTRPFLPGIDTEWVQQFRTQTLEQAVALLLDQARRAAPDQAVHSYWQLLSADPLLALAHEGLIRSLIDTGERAEAKQALRTYARMLEAEFQADVPAAFLNSLPAALIG